MNLRNCIDVNRRGDKDCVPVEKKDFIFVTLLVVGIICTVSFIWIYFILVPLSFIGQMALLMSFYFHVVPWMVLIGIILISFAFLVKFGFFDKKKEK